MDCLYGNGRKFASFLLNLSHFYTVCVSMYVCVHTMYVYPCMCVFTNIRVSSYACMCLCISSVCIYISSL